MHDKIFNITSDERNTNQNTTDTSPHSNQNNYIQENNNAGDYMEEEEHLHAVGEYVI